jgi:hypothetical protein
MGGGKGKENEYEKYWKSQSIHENIMYYTVSFLILGEHGERRRTSND